MPPGRASRSAFRPIQRLIFPGSIKNGKTVSGRAATRTWRSTTLVCSTATPPPPFFEFRCQLQPFQPLVPETLDEGPETGEALRPRSVQASCSFAPFGHQTGLLQDRQVLRDGRAGHVEPRRDLTRAQLAGRHELENPATPGLGEGANRCFHGSIVSISLRKGQLTKDGLASMPKRERRSQHGQAERQGYEALHRPQL